jgi:hypothetical protein
MKCPAPRPGFIITPARPLVGEKEMAIKKESIRAGILIGTFKLALFCTIFEPHAFARVFQNKTYFALKNNCLVIADRTSHLDEIQVDHRNALEASKCVNSVIRDFDVVNIAGRIQGKTTKVWSR